jgi:hypothetical protein
MPRADVVFGNLETVSSIALTRLRMDRVTCGVGRHARRRGPHWSGCPRYTPDDWIIA